MDRLTIKNGIDGNYVHRNMCFYGVDGHIDDCDGCMEYCEGMEGECGGCAIQECFNRLAEYEDTGLTPEQILEMDGMYKELSREVMAYRKIGTVEECRVAVERQKAKKPVKDEYCHECCPSCGWIVCKGEYGGRYLPHCENCGQAIDWRDSDV